MKKPISARTYAPIRLADLDPHRFEDLVRNLIYDYRSWNSIEAVGRAGDDGGFDVRGWEAATSETENVDGADEVVVSKGREWMFQCKRERTIGPKKLDSYLRGMELDGENLPFALVFVGSCDFSKRTQDTFRAVARELGFQEAHLLGRGEVEDLLFQPKNDHLLFAFFGISIQSRKRSTKTELRTKLVPKRKVSRIFKNGERHFLIRDPLDQEYPYWNEDQKSGATGRWMVLEASEICYDGIHFLWRRHPAYLGEDEKSWDFMEGHNSSIPHRSINPWEHRDKLAPKRGSWIEHHESMAQWNELSDDEQAWFTVTVVLPFEKILEIDEDGDDVCSAPHLYCDFAAREQLPFRDYTLLKVSTTKSSFVSGREIHPEDNNRIAKFKQAPLPKGRERSP